MRIAIIDPSSRSLPYDYFFIRELAKYYKIDFYCSHSSYNEEFIDAIKNIQNVNISITHISDRNRLSGTLNYLFLLMKILFRKNKYDRIHFMWSILPFMELPFFMLFRKKFIFTFHNDVPHSHRKKTYWFYHIIFGLSQKSLFISKNVKDDFLKNYKVVKPKNVLLLRHGIMSVDLNAYREETSSKKLQNKIVFWGNVKKYKGIETFLKIVRSELFVDFDFEIYGKWDKELLDVKERLINENVKIFDYYLPPSELINLLYTDALFILPYDKATQSGVLYTLLFYQRIFISTNTGDNGDFLISANLEDLLFENTNEADIKRAVDYCLDNECSIKKKLENRRELYKWENIITTDEKIYNLK